MNSWLIFTISMIFSASGVFLSLKVTQRFGILDIPNLRSSHNKPIPRSGGLGILMGITAAAIYSLFSRGEVPSWPLWAGLTVVAGVGLWDDVRGGIHFTVRLFAQATSAALIIALLGGFSSLPLPPPLDFNLGYLGIVLSILWIVAVLNFYNFMDGIDGIAGLQALISSIVVVVACGGKGAWLGLALAGSSAGFLYYNWHPAKIFLGDVGSYSLGILFATIPFLEGYSTERATMLIALSLWLFLADPTYTLVARLLNRERVWEAHRSHLYQRLVRTGLSHAQVSLLNGAASIVTSTFGIIAFTSNKAFYWWLAFLAASFIFIAQVLFVRKRERSS